MSIEQTFLATKTFVSPVTDIACTPHGIGVAGACHTDVQKWLIPDAQGHVSREEVMFAAVRSFLSAKEPQLENRFLSAFDECLNAELLSDSTIALVESALNKMLSDKLITPEETSVLIQQASQYAETF